MTRNDSLDARIDARVALFEARCEAEGWETFDGCVRQEVAAALLGYALRTLIGWRTQGIGPSYFRTRPLRYPIRELAEWLERRFVAG